jgi:hypothetical protein
MIDVLALAVERPTEARPEVVNGVVFAYLDWREESAWLDEAYEQWACCPEEDRGLAFAAYRAAFDREAAACRVYAIGVKRLERALEAGRA